MTARARSSRSSSSPPEHLLVGRVGRAVGLRGEVEITVLSDEPTRFDAGAALLTAGDLRPLTVGSRRAQGARTIVRFDEVPDRDAAEALRGTELVVPVAAARPLADGEWWDHDLEGCEVLTTDGTVVGTVREVLHGAANEILVVAGEGREHLVPLISQVVKDVVPRDRILIDPIAGLLDD